MLYCPHPPPIESALRRMICVRCKKKTCAPRQYTITIPVCPYCRLAYRLSYRNRSHKSDAIRSDQCRIVYRISVFKARIESESVIVPISNTAYDGKLSALCVRAPQETRPEISSERNPGAAILKSVWKTNHDLDLDPVFQHAVIRGARSALRRWSC